MLVYGRWLYTTLTELRVGIIGHAFLCPASPAEGGLQFPDHAELSYLAIYPNNSTVTYLWSLSSGISNPASWVEITRGICHDKIIINTG